MGVTKLIDCFIIEGISPAIIQNIKEPIKTSDIAKRYTIMYKQKLANKIFKCILYYKEVNSLPGRKNLYSGTVSYERLWETLKRRGLKKQDLKGENFNLSPTIVNRLAKNENVAVDTIMYLCDKLNCQPCDIMEYKKDI